MAALDGAVVVVTGASAGVGRAAVRAFAERGAAVALLARGEERLKAAQMEVEEMGVRAIAIPTDVADHRAVEHAADVVERELGPIDVWVNNALVSVFEPVAELTAGDVERVTDVTYLGSAYGTMAALRRMRPRDRGTIVQVGSALAYRSIPLQAAYCGAKHALRGFLDSLRTELIHERSNVAVAHVHLPALNTPQFHWVKTSLPRHPQPVPPIYQPEVAAGAIVWAAEHRPREANVGIVTTLTVLASKVVPGLLDRYLGRTGYDSQQADRPIEPDRPNNLWEPVPGDWAARGEFDDRAGNWSPQWWARTHRGLLAAAAGAVGVVAASVGRRR